MAEVISKRSIVYDITFNTRTAEKGAKDIGTALKGAEKEIDKATTAVNNFAAGTLSAGARLKQIKNELNNFKGTEAQFQALSFEAAKLSDQIQNTNRRITTLASSTRNIQALVSAFSGLTGVFTAIQGAQALFGKESQDVQRALVKLQGSLALLQGVQAAVATVTEQSAAKTVILNNVQKLYTFITNGATVATKAFRAALISTVVGAVIVGIAALVANWDKLKALIEGASKESERFAKAEVSRLDFQIEKAKLLGKSTDDLREQQLDAQLQLANAQKDEEKQIDVLNQKKLLALELENRKAKEGFEEKKRIKQLEIELAEDGSEQQLKLQQELVDIERSIRTAGEKLTQEELILVLQAAELKKRKLRMEFLLKQREDIKDIIFDPNLWIKERDALIEELQRGSDVISAIFGLGKEPEIKPIIKTDALEEGTQKLREATQEAATFGEVVQDNAEQIGESFATIFSNMSTLAKEGSQAQMAFSIANILAANAEALALSIKAAAGTTWPANIPAILSSVAMVTSMFAQVKSVLSQAQSAQSSAVATAFAEGEVDIHRPGEQRGKDSIAAVIMPGESVLTTRRTKEYKPLIQAIHDGTVDELIKLNYIEPALALSALNTAKVDSSEVIDYSEKFYRQYLATGEGNLNSKRMIGILASIDRKLGTKPERYSR